MIPRTVPTWQHPRWQDELADLIKDPRELFELLELDLNLLPEATLAHADFALRVPRAFVRRMRKGDPNDPLLMQVLPLGEELDTSPGYQHDPVGDLDANPVPGLIHKYHGRVLLVAAGNCAINCRYCFRRHFPYQDNQPNRKQWQAAVDYIAADSSINEVIYSGGDPLALANKQLRWLTETISEIPHVQRLRVHTRLPVVAPSRIDDECLEWLSQHRLQTVVVLHINHAQEIDDEVRFSLQRLQQAGITLLNQTVLLRGVNNNIEALCALSEALFQAGVLPYYLHLLDKVAGAKHFDVPADQAKQLRELMLNRLPGYLVPKFVQEIAGKPSKVPL